MAAEAGAGWKPMGWNGVRLNVPAHWETSVLGPFHLQLDDGAGPALELSWRRLSRGLSSEPHLKRLIRQFRHRPGVEFREGPVPREWREVLDSFSANAFAWSAADTRGEGALLSCPLCGTVTLVQFLSRLEPVEPRLAVEVLRSFRDHSENEMVTWALFGMHAEVPEGFRLEEHRFSPGYYELRFAQGGEKLTLRRWSPANVILRGRDLRSWFLATMVGNPLASRIFPREGGYRGHAALEGEKGPGSGGLSRVRAFFRRTDRYGRMRIWHRAHDNQIMGIEVCGPRLPDEARFEEICDHYRVVSGTELPGEGP